MNGNKLTGQSPIGKYPPGGFQKLCSLLNVGDAWKKLVEFIPNRQRTGLRFTIDDVNQFELQKDPTKALLNAWATDCVALNDLIHVLDEANYFRESNLVQQAINPLQPSLPCVPPAVTTATEQSQLSQLARYMTNVQPTQPTRALPAHHGGNFTYAELAKYTNNFDQRPVRNGGCLVGQGGSADVFRGIRLDTGQPMAIKRLKNNCQQNQPLNISSDAQFWNEFNILSTLPPHENLIRFMGWSSDGPALCIVCEYMPGGSLQDRLAGQSNTEPLSARERIVIAQDTACAICHLHSFNLIHRDVKSANILLTGAGRAKLGDYGIARVGPRENADETMTQRIVGTTPYMALEYLRDGELSLLTDSYSFGVVLLELLTGLRPLDSQRKEKILVSHMEENCTDIHSMVDRRAGPWPSGRSIDAIYRVAQQLLSNKSSRPLVSTMLPEIESWTNTYDETELQKPI